MCRITQWPPLKKPAGFQDAFEEAISIIDMEIPRVLKEIKKIYDDILITPVYSTGRGYIVADGIYDTGYMKFGVWTVWTPHKAWMSRESVV